MTIRLLHDVDRTHGLTRNRELQVYEGPGEENGTTTSGGQPTGAVWVQCPTVPIVRNRAGDVVSWRNLYAIIQPTDFEVLTDTAAFEAREK